MRHSTLSFSARAASAVGLLICGSALLLSCADLSTPARPVQRVILLWLKHPGRPEERAQLIRAARSLRSMPGVLRVESGRAAPPLPNDADRSFDLAIVITFRDRAALERYEQNSPDDAMRSYLAPLVARYTFYDVPTR